MCNPNTHLLFPVAKHPHYTKHPPNAHVTTLSDAVSELKSLLRISSPVALAALITYSRSILSMLFLGRLGDLHLAAGSLAIAFANISGYSVLSGLSLGMEPICSQAFGAHRPKLLSLTLQRAVVFLLLCSIPISLLWLHVSSLLRLLSFDHALTRVAHTYLLFSLPDLVTNSFLHPLRIYLRSQNITVPLTAASAAGAAVLFPANLLLRRHGVAGVAAAAAISNFFVLFGLICYIFVTKIHEPTWTKPSRECLTGWKPLVRLAAPSCVSVCLEWWWYEIMIVMCGFLVGPTATVASMGVLIQTTSLIYVFPSSLGLAVSTRVGNELGANRPVRAKLSAAVAVLCAGAMGVLAMVFAVSMRDTWGGLFTNDAEIVRLTSIALPILGLCELGNCPQTVACGVVRGSARPETAAKVNVGAFYVVGMPVAVGLGFFVGLGFCGLWMGLLAAQVCCAGLMLYVVGTTDWDLQAERAQALMCTAPDAAAAPGHGLLKQSLPSGDGDNIKGEQAQPLIWSISCCDNDVTDSKQQSLPNGDGDNIKGEQAQPLIWSISYCDNDVTNSKLDGKQQPLPSGDGDAIKGEQEKPLIWSISCCDNDVTYSKLDSKQDQPLICDTV